MKGNADMSATTGETDEGDKSTFSDAGVKERAKKEKEVELFIVDNIRPEQEDHSFHILILPYLIVI